MGKWEKGCMGWGTNRVREVGNAAKMHVGPIWGIHDENPTWVPQDTH